MDTPNYDMGLQRSRWSMTVSLACVLIVREHELALFHVNARHELNSRFTHRKRHP